MKSLSGVFGSFRLHRATMIALALCAASVGVAYADVHAASTPAPLDATHASRTEMPEPANMLLLGSALVGLSIAARRSLSRRRD